MPGTGSWEPIGSLVATVRVRCTPRARVREDGADGRVPGRGALADLALGERLFGVGEHRDDALLGGFAVRRMVVCGVVAQPQRGAPSSASSSAISLRLAAARCSTLMTICPFRRRRYRLLSPQAWSSDDPRRAWPGRVAALPGVVHEHDGGVEPSLQLAQESEDGGDLRRRRSIDAVQAHQGVEDKQAWPDALDGVVQALAVAFEASRRQEPARR